MSMDGQQAAAVALQQADLSQLLPATDGSISRTLSTIDMLPPSQLRHSDPINSLLWAL
jgi:hypothetical protein